MAQDHKLSPNTLYKLAQRENWKQQQEQFQSRLEGRIEARLKAIQQSAISRAERSGLLSTHVGAELRWKLDTELTLLLEKEDLKSEVPLPKA